MSASVVTDFPFSLEVEHVLRGQGVDPSRARPKLFATARDVLDEARSLLVPAALYTVLSVREFEHQRVILDGGAVFEGPLVARALAGATEIALAVCTVGPALDERVSALFADDPVRAMALDGAGIGAVGGIARLTGERIREEAEARSLRIGMRAEPGQEGWSIWQQRVLFGLLPTQEISVQLTDSCLMLPRKSISFAVGLGPQMRPDAVTCDFCSKRERCQWRTHSDG
ncbi:MAG: hypothetical protein U9R15_20530 [Chloroflexota bacterium]|nr:hypothetical protein [Chloroflexota bacterium]